MDFKLNNETEFVKKMAKAIQEEQNLLLSKSDVQELIRTYFDRRLYEGRCVDVGMSELKQDLTLLLNDLPAYNLQRTVDKLQGKRYWDAMRIVEGGWKHGE